MEGRASNRRLPSRPIHCAVSDTLLDAFSFHLMDCRDAAALDWVLSALAERFDAVSLLDFVESSDAFKTGYRGAQRCNDC